MIISIDELKIHSIANARFHWRTLAAEKAKQRRIVHWATMGKKPPPLPVVVTLCRIGVRDLDDDNLAHAFKAVRDEIAQWLGCDDGPKSPVDWRYMQRRGKPKQYAVEITIEPREAT